MKVYRQTARFVLAGILIASMVFCIQTAAIAGAGPEPGENCKLGGLKAKYVAPPYFVDIVATFAGNESAGTVTLTTTVTGPKNKGCSLTATQTTSPYSLVNFNKETTKNALQSLCIHNIVMGDSSNQLLFCDTESGHYLEVIAVTQYKRVGNTVTASLIVMEITF